MGLLFVYLLVPLVKTTGLNMWIFWHWDSQCIVVGCVSVTSLWSVIQYSKLNPTNPIKQTNVLLAVPMQILTYFQYCQNNTSILDKIIILFCNAFVITFCWGLQFLSNEIYGTGNQLARIIFTHVIFQLLQPSDLLYK